jgi:hypothetical protein
VTPASISHVSSRVSISFQKSPTAFWVIRVDCGTPGFHPYELPRGCQRKVTFHFHDMLTVQHCIPACYADQPRDFPLKDRPSVCKHLLANSREHGCGPKLATAASWLPDICESLRTLVSCTARRTGYLGGQRCAVSEGASRIRGLPTASPGTCGYRGLSWRVLGALVPGQMWAGRFPVRTPSARD